MIVKDDRTLPTVPRRRARRTVLRTAYALTSVRTANLLIAAMAVAGAVGIVLQQFGTLTLRDPVLLETAIQRLPMRYGQPWASLIERLDLYRIFTSWWWTLLVVALSASVIGNTLIRLPRLVRDIRTPPVKRARAFFRSSISARTGPLEGVDGSPLAALLQSAGYRVHTETTGAVTHLLGERNRLAPLATVLTHGSLVLFVIGMGIVTPRFGYESTVTIPVGESRPTGFPSDPQTVLIRNEAFVAEFDRAGLPTTYRTTIAVYREGRLIARKEITINDPLSVDGWVFHENFFGPAVVLDVRDARGSILFSGSVLLDGSLGGKPEGLLELSGTDVRLELLLGKDADGRAELTVIGARPPIGDQEGPQIVFGAVLRTGDGYLAPDPGIGVEFRAASSYIGLITTRDPGQGLIWLGAVLLVVGISVSLLRPRRRVWARYDAETVRLAVVGGDPFPEDECARIVAELPSVPPRRWSVDPG